MSDLGCIDCESLDVHLYANDPNNPTHYYYGCSFCGNHSAVFTNMIDAERDWMNQYWRMIPYQMQNIVEHLNNKRRLS